MFKIDVVTKFKFICSKKWLDINIYPDFRRSNG